jgi:acyl-CoA synthetase (AMP-forming)/AMP-acid ligase II
LQFGPPENDYLAPSSTVTSPLPFFHIYGLVCGALAQGMLGNTLTTLRSFDLVRASERASGRAGERAGRRAGNRASGRASARIE